MNTNFKVTGLIRLGIKPKSTAFEADALTTRPSELLIKQELVEIVLFQSFIYKLQSAVTYITVFSLSYQ